MGRSLSPLAYPRLYRVAVRWGFAVLRAWPPQNVHHFPPNSHNWWNNFPARDFVHPCIQLAKFQNEEPHRPHRGAAEHVARYPDPCPQ
jgi:hypothetical protein